MSVRKLPNGRWEARERTGGRGSPRPTRTFDLKSDADAWVTKMRRQRQLGEPLREDVTLAAFMETYWEFHAVPNLAASTRAVYKAAWGKHIVKRLGSRNLRELTPKVLTRFRADLEKAGVGSAMVRKSMALVQSILSFAVVEGHLELNPAAAVRKPRDVRKRQPMIFLPSDVEALRGALLKSRRSGLQLGLPSSSPSSTLKRSDNAAPTLSAALISVLAYAGPRPEEALRLRWVDVGSETLHFLDTKRHRERYTPLLAPLAADLREWRLASGRPSPRAPVLPAHDAGHWQLDDWRNFRRRIWRPLAPEGSRPRDLRSSYATVQIYAGEPLTTVAKWMGTSVAMLDRHYSGVIANAPATRVPAEEQIMAARAAQSPARHADHHGS